MDDKFKSILEILEKTPARSRLKPYGELIDELRRRRRTYRDIARILTEECNFKTSRSTVYDFVRSRLRTSSKPNKGDAIFSKRCQVIPAKVDATEISPISREMNVETTSDVRQRIAALKRKTMQAPEGHELFLYDPGEPLRLPLSNEKPRNRKEH